MAYVAEQKVGKHTYLYECVAYRNEDGQPRNKRKPIGKIDPATGKPVYKPEYLERMAAAGRPIDTQPAESFTAADIMCSSIKDYGAFYLFHKLAEQSGLLGVLQSSLPKRWEEIFNLAAYLISTGDPFAYCEDWLGTVK